MPLITDNIVFLFFAISFVSFFCCIYCGSLFRDYFLYDFRIAVDDAALLRNGINNVGSFQSDGQRERLAGPGFPMDSTLAVLTGPVKSGQRGPRAGRDPNVEKSRPL